MRALAGLLLLACIAWSTGVAAPTGVAATSSVTVDMTVRSSTTFDPSGCLTGVAGKTDLGTVSAGSGTVGTLDCSLQWGSNNDSSMLRLYQQDGIGNAMEGGFDDTGLLGWWDLDGDATDRSSLANTGTLSGGAAYVSGKPGLGQALNVDGASGQISIPHNAAYQLEEFTVDAWFRTSDVSHTASPNIVHLGLAPTNRNFAITMTQSTNGIAGFLSIAGTGRNITYANCGCIDGQWHHAAFTRDAAGVLVLYVDGVQRATNTYAGNVDNPVAPLYIGRRETNPPNSVFKGDIDRVRIWSRVLTQPEIQTWYEGLVDDYQSGTADWSTGTMFGACLRQTINSTAVWSAGPGNACPQTNGTYWRAIPAAAGASAKIASGAAGETGATTHIRFGFRADVAALDGAYLAPVTFEVLAPNA